MELQRFSVSRDEYLISTDPSKIDFLKIHHFLSTQAYWCPGIPYDRVKRAGENSLCFGLYHFGEQVGYARVISDYTTIAYLGDVFIVPEHRGRGLSKWLIQSIQLHPDLQRLRRWILLTRDAHGLYAQSGWSRIAQPELWMEIHQKELYRQDQD